VQAQVRDRRSAVRIYPRDVVEHDIGHTAQPPPTTTHLIVVGAPTPLSKAALFAEIERLAAADRDAVVPPVLLDGLTAIADSAPPHARAIVPVHADCHWGNWLASEGSVTALLDFEWARFGEPADDWFFPSP
jgi:aminoglycoside phosphotransferase (APT) family kinase protein